METQQQLYFVNQISQQKPNSMQNKESACPFCDHTQLSNILETDETIIWLKNKYPTLQNTLQTVIIEIDNCHDHIATYTKEHMRKLIRFSVGHWLSLEQSGKFRSVILYKNHGPLSGGTIHHAHMQIIGMEQVDYRQNVRTEHFKGIVVSKEHGIELNISTHPIIGFTEFNILIENTAQIDLMADYIQRTVCYVLHDFHKQCNSYNMFFYSLDGNIMCKIVPRFVVSPLYVGYNIPQVSTQLQAVKEQLETYFTEK
ncbi:DUF4931 domain-containing protein [Bacillus sp. S10(2024)]|uniref:DUF4931 domain-containing protein n=1 Tax=Bacillus sp. S10(2024) TaxID=3162886 RepID=UPI003D192807